MTEGLKSILREILFVSELMEQSDLEHLGDDDSEDEDHKN